MSSLIPRYPPPSLNSLKALWTIRLSMQGWLREVEDILPMSCATLPDCAVIVESKTRMCIVKLYPFKANIGLYKYS